jgi:AraC-like DNA-binding protein
VIETLVLSVATQRTDLFADVLGQVRLSGALYLKGRYNAPWALDSPQTDQLIALLSPGAERLIPFHILRSGRAWSSAGGMRIEAQAGDLIVVPHAHQHMLGGPEPHEPVFIGSLLPPRPWLSMPVCRIDNGGELAEIDCGYFRCDELLFNTVLRHLPPVFVVRPTGRAAQLLLAAADVAVEESIRRSHFQSPLSARLPELLLVEALRIYSESDASASGWLAATRDPIVARALRLIHDDPVFDWTVEELARRAATSRSVLGERFRQLLGQSPMAYVAEWRMQIAANLLRTTALRLADVAERSGYGSEAAFSRAFHRHLGVSPAAWRAGTDTGSRQESQTPHEARIEK